MDCLLYNLIISIFCINLVVSDIYSSSVSTLTYVNEVEDNFLSFSLDPKFLFRSIEKGKRDDYAYMATHLSPAYIRIAGPTTSSLTFRNSSIALDIELQNKIDEGISVSDQQWQTFANWANASNFEIVFALNPAERTASGMWNANSALSILSTAEMANIYDIVWALGYECKNQTIEEYLHDLETLKIIIETFPTDDKRWRVVAGDVTSCLQEESKNDFKDYILKSNDMLDAILLNGNSSVQELEKMTQNDTEEIRNVLSTSDIPLWLTEKNTHDLSEVDRAADWLLSLGYSARHGFNVHFRELSSEEMEEPTLSFYMALLYKHLVGNRVLNVDFEPNNTDVSLFCHCTSLRQDPIDGAITLFGANMDDAPSMISVKFSENGKAGDVFQYVLALDTNGNIVVNGRVIYHQGDTLKPLVRRVRPYRSILLTLPPKTFGFWVVANSEIEACRNLNSNENEVRSYTKATSVETSSSYEHSRIKRFLFGKKPTSLIDFKDTVFDIENEIEINDIKDELYKQIDGLPEIWNPKSIYKDGSSNVLHKRIKRNVNELSKAVNNIEHKNRNNVNQNKKIIVIKHPNIHNRIKPRLFQRLQIKLKGSQTNDRFNKKNNYLKRRAMKRVNKRHYLLKKNKETIVDEPKNNRTRRSLMNEELKNKSFEKGNINIDKHDLYRMLDKLTNTVESLPRQIQKYKNRKADSSQEGIILQTTLSDDDAAIDVIENSSKGFLKTTVESVASIVDEIKDKLHKVWSAISQIDY